MFFFRRIIRTIDISAPYFAAGALLLILFSVLSMLEGLTAEAYRIGLIACVATCGVLCVVIMAVSYRKSKEEEKQNTGESIEEKYQAIMEHSPLCIKVFDADRNLIFINKGGREEHGLVGMNDEQIRNWKWWETVKPGYQKEAMEKFKRAFELGEAGRIDFEHTPEGSTHEWCSSLISPVKNAQGKVTSVLFLSDDISALKRTELRATENAVMFRTLLDETPLCIKWFDKYGKLISINKHGREEHFLTGMTEEEIAAWDYSKSMVPDQIPFFNGQMERAIQGETGSFSIQHLKGTATSEWCEAVITPIKNSEGAVEYILFLSRDVTKERLIEQERSEHVRRMEETKVALFNILEDVKESEAKLADERDRSQAIISSMGEGLLVIDADHIVLTMNQMAERMFGVQAEDAIGKPVKDIFTLLMHDEIVANDNHPLARVFATGTPLSFDISDQYFCRTRKNSVFPIAFFVTPMQREHTRAAVVVFRDISEEKRLDDAKSDFISMASHQLKTPLNVLSWQSEALLEEADTLPEEKRTQVQDMYTQTQQLLATVTMLLNVSRLEAGKFVKNIEPVDIVAGVTEAVKELEPLQKEKQIHVSVESPRTPFPPINLEPEMLRQVTLNLIANAIQYTPKDGSINVQFDSNEEGITFSVNDTGMGISEEAASRIFERFYRAPAAKEMVPGGTGLGLNFARNVAREWGGDVWFTSKEGEGTTFFVRIPKAGMQVKGLTEK